MLLQVYVGEEGDATKKGGSIMGFCKSWRSLPIRSWSGGAKVADMPGARQNCAVTSALSTLMAAEVRGSPPAPLLTVNESCSTVGIR